MAIQFIELAKAFASWCQPGLYNAECLLKSVIMHNIAKVTVKWSYMHVRSHEIHENITSFNGFINIGGEFWALAYNPPDLLLLFRLEIGVKSVFPV